MTLFVFMNMGALVGFYQDTAERRQQLRRLCQPGMGFNDRNGVWTWTFQQNELRHAVEAPSGSAVSIAGEFGFPFLRLRLALPEELFAGSVAQSMGRRDGFSVRGLQDARDENVAVMKQLQRTMSCFSSPDPTARAQIPALLEDADDTKKRRLSAPRAQALAAASMMPVHRSPWSATSSSEPRPINADMFDYDPSVSLADVYASPPDPRDLVGTALVFAFMANQKTLPVTELSARTEAARAYFADLRVTGIDHGFGSLYSKFLLMLGPEAGTLTARDKWMATSRLWRFVLLQREDGGFDLTQSLAIALEAHDGEPPPVKESKWHKRFAVLAGLCAGDDDDLGDVADGAMSSDDDDAANAGRPQHEAKKIKDCPISFSVAAVRRRVPPALLLLNDSYDHDPALRRAHSRLLSRRSNGTAPSRPLSPYTASPHDSCSSQAYMVRRVDTESSTNSEAAAGFGIWEVAPIFVPLLACESAHDLAAAEECAVDDAVPVPVDRIWATSLSVAVLKGLDISWLLDDEAVEGEEQTIVDAAVKWLQAQGAANSRVQALLDSGELAAAADKAVSSWKKVLEHNISELRNTDVLSKFTTVTHVQHATSRVIKSIMTEHGALRVISLLATFA